jgi:hypothetical protein
MLNSLARMYELVAQGHATAKENGDLVTFKYHRNVQFKSLWNKIPGILECRGHTYSKSTAKPVLVPPPKSFNYGENATFLQYSDDTEVVVAKKYNGFLGSAAMLDDELIVGTTGTTTSDYAKIARREIEKYISEHGKLSWGLTMVFEIIVDEDPHIVQEDKSGAIPLINRTNYWDSDISAYNIKCMTLAEVKELAKNCKHEGFMVYHKQQYFDGVAVPDFCKMKSPYYVQKKKIMRMPEKVIISMYDSPTKRQEIFENFDSTWKDVLASCIAAVDKETWISYTDQDRRKVIERFI